MTRIVIGVVAGFMSWMIAWFGCETILSALWPSWYGAQQDAFQSVLVNGGQFAAQASFLLTNITCGAVVSLLAGCLAARVARENKRTPPSMLPSTERLPRRAFVFPK